MTLRAVVADDQPVICAGFAALLDAQPDIEVVGTAANGRELVSLVERHRPDVALVDVRMPVLDGIAATGLITSDYPTKVLVLTPFDLDEYVFEAIKNGASGFLLKAVTAARLVEGVRLVADGSTDLADTGVSAREQEVLLLLARGRSNAEIADELVIGVETVKSHVAEILRKLNLRDRIQAVVFAYENGLVVRGE